MKSRKDKEFIDEVWKKVRYMEYIRNEEERVYELENRLKKKRNKLFGVFIISVIMILVPMFYLKCLDNSIVITIGIYVLSFGCYCENYINTNKYDNV